MQPFKVDWRPAAIEDVRALFEYLAENASLWDAEHVTERVLRCTDKLTEFPRLYEADPRYGEGVSGASVWWARTSFTKWTTNNGRSRSWPLWDNDRTQP